MNRITDIVKPVKYTSFINNHNKIIRGLKHSCPKLMKRKRNIIMKNNINKIL